MDERIQTLYSNDTKLAYQTLLELEELSEKSSDLYDYFDEFIKMLDDASSLVRARGFRLICSIAKWDKEKKIDKNIDKILKELDDEKGTAVRDVLTKIHLLMMYKKELKLTIKNKLENLNLSNYKETMQSLIKKDIEKILKMN